MEEKNNEINTLIPRKILVPIEDTEPEFSRPSMSMKSNDHTLGQNNFVESNKRIPKQIQQFHQGILIQRFLKEFPKDDL